MFSDKLKKLRADKEITQQQLADYLKVSPATVGNWEQGTRNPQLNYLIEMAKYFCVSLDELTDFNVDNYKKSTSSQLSNDVEIGTKNGTKDFTKEQIEFIDNLIKSRLDSQK